MLSLSADHWNDARAELLCRITLRSEDSGIVVDAGIDEEHAALTCTVVAGAKVVDAAGLDVDARYLSSVVSCEYGELDCATPGVRREDGVDVFVTGAAFRKNEARRAMCEQMRMCVGFVKEEDVIIPTRWVLSSTRLSGALCTLKRGLKVSRVRS